MNTAIPCPFEIVPSLEAINLFSNILAHDSTFVHVLYPNIDVSIQINYRDSNLTEESYKNNEQKRLHLCKTYSILTHVKMNR